MRIESLHLCMDQTDDPGRITRRLYVHRQIEEARLLRDRLKEVTECGLAQAEILRILHHPNDERVEFTTRPDFLADWILGAKVLLRHLLVDDGHFLSSGL